MVILAALTLLQDVEVVHRAASWETLVEVARPSATVERELLLWCEAQGDGAWAFTLAAAFHDPTDFEAGWYVLRAGQTPWWRSGYGGAFLIDRATFPCETMFDQPRPVAERVGERGDLFKIACPSIPGGAHGNQFYQVVLTRRDDDGSWTILWHGDETAGWNMGSHIVHTRVEFTLSGTAIEVDSTVSLHLFAELNADQEMVLHRKGALAGEPPMRIEWTTPLQYEAGAGDTWESVARRALNYRRLTADDLKRWNPDRAGRELRAGDRVVIHDARP